MFTTKTKKYTNIKPETNSVAEFYLDFKNRYPEFENENLIIDFSEEFNIKIEELILFLKLSVQHQENGTSFVLICKGINIDSVPDELNVVPTLTEAIDILEMDAIERELGF